jgi:predicted DCC family thiol-disulfide oxidoreductase YuxK
MRIIYFDGVCNLCNGFVDFVIQRDKEHLFYFAPIQGKSALEKLSHQDLGLDTVVYYDHGQVYKKSSAVLKIARELGAGYRFFSTIASALPVPILNFFYDFVAQNRYLFFGKKESCRLPTPEERKLFLD